MNETQAVLTRPSAGRDDPVSIRGLTKRYGSVAVVDDVNLTVETGDVFGFLGPNGAGKTTTLRMLLGLIHADAGSIQLFGRDPAVDVVRALEGVAGIIEEPRLYTYLSGRRNLELLGAFDRQGVGQAEIDEVLELVELRDRADDRVDEYSQGMRQRLGIASCLVRRPRLLILDEPANGVDPAGLRDLRDLIRRLAGEGITIMLSSHLLAEVDEVCTRVAVISAGRIVYDGSLSELHASAGARYRLRASDASGARTLSERLDFIRELRDLGGELSFGLDEADAARLTRAFADAGLGILSLTREEESLERLFFRLTEPPATTRETNR
jgi:ABC-2 type transport system ATP-binding protein